MNANNAIEMVKSLTVGEHVMVNNAGHSFDTFRSVNIVKTSEGFSVIDNGEETEAATAEEAMSIAADYIGLAK